MNSAGTFYGVGVGPGDPELLTLKAHRLITSCHRVAYLCSERGNAMARDIASDSLKERSASYPDDLAIEMPMSDDRESANQAYDKAAAEIALTLDQGKDVVFLCLGDPLLFGSFYYLAQRLASRYPVEAVPGVSSVGAATALGECALGLQVESIAIVSGRCADDHIRNTLEQYDSIIIMKPGRRRPELVSLIQQAGRIADTSYIEYAGMKNQRLVRDISTLGKGNGPYFSMLLVSRNQYSPGVT